MFQDGNTCGYTGSSYKLAYYKNDALYIIVLNSVEKFLTNFVNNVLCLSSTVLKENNILC